MGAAKRKPSSSASAFARANLLTDLPANAAEEGSTSDILDSLPKPKSKPKSSSTTSAKKGRTSQASVLAPFLADKFDRMITAARHQMNLGQIQPTRASQIGHLGGALGGIDRIDISYLCGLHGYSYMGITSRDRSDQPIQPIPRALLVKLYHKKPEVSLIERANRPADLHSLIKQVPGYESITQNMFAAMLGLERGSYHRYSVGGKTSPVIDRLVTAACRYLKRRDIMVEDRIELIDTLLRNAIEEAVVRGYDMDLFRQRGFATKKTTTPEERKPRVSRVSRARAEKPTTGLRPLAAAAAAALQKRLASTTLTDEALRNDMRALRSQLQFASKSPDEIPAGQILENTLLVQAADHVPACEALLKAARAI